MSNLKLVCPNCESANIGKIETKHEYNISYYCFNCDEKFNTCTLDNSFLYALSVKHYIHETKKELLKEIENLKILMESKK